MSDLGPMVPIDSVDSRTGDFALLCEQAATGQQLPSAGDLIRGCPFFLDDIRADAKAFGEAMLVQLGAISDSETRLLFALGELLVEPSPQDYVIAAREFESARSETARKFASIEAHAARCSFYATLVGDAESAPKVAAYAVTLAYARDLPFGITRSQVTGAVAWLLVATNKLQVPSKWTRHAARDFISNVDNGNGPGRAMVDKMMEGRHAVMSVTIETTAPPESIAEHHEAETSMPVATVKTPNRHHLDDDESDGVVVIRSVGNDASPEGRRVMAEFQSLIGERLPLVPLPDLTMARRDLIEEFPHARSVIDNILGALPGPSCVKLQPTLFVGPPGCGKTTLAIRLSQILGLSLEIFSCGGVSDAAFSGTPRRWTTGEPSIPLSAIRTHRSASPAILLDEIDKAATSKTNGALVDTILGFLEDRTAAAWRDPYIEAAIDLSGVIWMLTANSTDNLPQALMDRCRIVAFPSPRCEHLAVLAHRILIHKAAAGGLDPRWVLPLDALELTALGAAWQGGSIRRLAKLADAVAAARERFSVSH